MAVPKNAPFDPSKMLAIGTRMKSCSFENPAPSLPSAKSAPLALKLRTILGRYELVTVLRGGRPAERVTLVRFQGGAATESGGDVSLSWSELLPTP